MKNTTTAWAAFSGNLYLPAYSHSTKKDAITDLLYGGGFDSYKEAKKAGYTVRKIKISWEESK